MIGDFSVFAPRLELMTVALHLHDLVSGYTLVRRSHKSFRRPSPCMYVWNYPKIFVIGIVMSPGMESEAVLAQLWMTCALQPNPVVFLFNWDLILVNIIFYLILLIRLRKFVLVLSADNTATFASKPQLADVFITCLDVISSTSTEISAIVWILFFTRFSKWYIGKWRTETGSCFTCLWYKYPNTP